MSLAVPHFPRAALPLWSRLFDRAPAPPVFVGAAVGAALLIAFLALDLVDGNLAALLAGEVPFWRHVEVRSATLIAALVAGVVVTHRHEETGTRRDLYNLAPALAPDAIAMLDALTAPGARALRWAGACGALMIACLVPALYRDPSRFLHLETWALPSVLFDLGVGATLGWATSRTLYAAVCQDRAFARLAGAVREVDVLDLRPLRPFARRGLRRALRWLLLASLACLAFVDAGYVEPPALVLVGIVGFALFSFLLPLLGIHARIRAEKQSLLDELAARIRAERARLHADTEAGGRASLADLLAYEARVASAREWPFDATTLLRLAIFLLLPLGSWLASALVQHVVETALR